MLKFERFFRAGVLILFVINVLVTLASMSLIERMIPTHDSNFRLIMAQRKALQTLLAARMDPAAFPRESEALESAILLLQDQKAWSKEQQEHLDRIRLQVLALKDTNTVPIEDFFRSWKALSDLQRLREEQKLESFRNAGLAGSWVVGAMSLVSLLALFIFQLRAKRLIVLPAAELVRGLNDWWSGNRQRRMRCPKSASEIHDSVRIVNDILDDQ